MRHSRLIFLMLEYTGGSELLVDTLGTAMLHNPRAVLPLVDSDKAGRNLLDAAHLCVLFISDDVSF